MSSWLPAGLPTPFADLARAIDKQFAPRLPKLPPRLIAFAAADLTDDHAARNPFGLAIDADTGALVTSIPIAGVFKWRKYDGSAL